MCHVVLCGVEGIYVREGVSIVSSGSWLFIVSKQLCWMIVLE